MVGVVAGLPAWAIFFDSAPMGGNSFQAGTVSISDDDPGSAMFSLTGMKPSDSAVSRCILVTYDGSIPATVRLYGTVSGTLATYLNLTVERGTGAAFGSCGSFAADSTDYLGSGPGVVYSGTLAGYPSTYASGIVDPPSGGAETWTTSETHAYRFTVSVQNDPSARSTTASATFTWEAR
jgi:hypothetical protein